MRRSIRMLASGLVAAALAAGCADSGYDYVKSSGDKTYFKVPSEWTLYDEEAIVDDLANELTDAQRTVELESAWQVAFDASPKPSIKHIVKGVQSHPSGFAEVRPLDGETADAISLAAMRNFYIDLDTALEEEVAEVVEYEELQPDGGFRGIHMVARLQGESGVVTFDQTILVDQATSKVYALLVRCSEICYERNADDIETVVGSWTVRAK